MICDGPIVAVFIPALKDEDITVILFFKALAQLISRQFARVDHVARTGVDAQLHLFAEAFGNGRVLIPRLLDILIIILVQLPGDLICRQRSESLETAILAIDFQVNFLAVGGRSARIAAVSSSSETSE